MSTLTITIIQPNLHWENKKANLDILAKKIDGIQEKTEVVILPEMFSTGFSMNAKMLAEKMSGETVGWMKRIASSKKIILTWILNAKTPATRSKRIAETVTLAIKNIRANHYVSPKGK